MIQVIEASEVMNKKHREKPLTYYINEERFSLKNLMGWEE